MIVATHRLPGLVLTDHRFELPLCHTDSSDTRTISVFARELSAPGTDPDRLPWLVFFQGGPGGKSPRPIRREGWISRACQDYRVLLLDQRGTGLSSVANRQTLAALGSAELQAEYLRHLRADAIVADAERIRAELAGPETQWSALGQSYGGFCVLRYLSAAPEGLREVFITGGLAPLTGGTDDVYLATYPIVEQKNDEFFTRYPKDAKRARTIADILRTERAELPNGERLSPRRFQTLGIVLGMSDGFERLHYWLEEALISGPGGKTILSDTFLHDVAHQVSFAHNPLYAVLQEVIYCQGQRSNWAAERLRSRFPRFDLGASSEVMFTGEMMYPWHFDEDACLRPLGDAAHALASYDGWPKLYDLETLRGNRVPVAAAIYAEDPYVARSLSETTAAAVGNLRAWITNEYQHDGLRVEGKKVLGRLIDMVRGEA
jgi:pimeloyl-ACP methyl ester carboxylesterase